MTASVKLCFLVVALRLRYGELLYKYFAQTNDANRIVGLCMHEPQCELCVCDLSTCRTYYSQIFELYHKCPSVQFLKELSDRDFCEAILIAFGLDEEDYQLGVSKARTISVVALSARAPVVSRLF